VKHHYGKDLSNLIITVVVLWAAFAAVAQENTERLIRDVKIEGLQRISEAAARARIEVQPGTAYSAPAVARDIKRLYETDFFETVNAEVREAGAQVDLIYSVTEKRVIDEVRIIGNRKVRTPHLRAVLKMREGASFDPNLFEEERQAILGLAFRKRIRGNDEYRYPAYF